MNIPECMESLGNNQYRCTKYGFTITTTDLPIRCSLCSPPINISPANTKELPSLGKQAINLGKAVVKHTINKFKRVDEEEFKRRFRICKEECDCLVVVDNQVRCSECGCFIDKKLWWESESCPKGNW